MDETICLGLMVIFLTVDRMWFIYLYYKQIKVYQQNLSAPKILDNLITSNNFDRLRIHGLNKMKFLICTTFVGFLVFGYLELYLGLFPFLWDVASCICQRDNGVVVNLLFVFIFIWYMTLKVLPAFLYEKCILEIQFKRNGRTTFGNFIYAYLKCPLKNQAYLLPLAYVVVILVDYCEKNAIIFIWLLVGLVSLAFSIILPAFVEPRIFQFKNLNPGTLKRELNKLTRLVGFPLSKIYIMQTKYAYECGNAYFSGVGFLKRIVIIDTLLPNAERKTNRREVDHIRGLTDKQVAAVVAHELGHWNGYHYLIQIILKQIHIILTVFIIGFFVECHIIYEAVGFEPAKCPVIAGAIITYFFIITPYRQLANYVWLRVLRKFECSADSFAYVLGYSSDLKMSLLKMYMDCPGWPLFDGLYFDFHEAHPTILQRVNYINKLND